MEPVVPLPGPDEVKLTRPDAVEVAATARGIASVVAPAGGLSDLQRVLLEALFPAMTDHPVGLAALEPINVAEAAEVLRRRNLQFRRRGVQVALLAGLILRPLPTDVAERIARFAWALGVDEGVVGVARRFAAGSLGLAAFDFQRNGYTADWTRPIAGSCTRRTSWPRRGTWRSTTRPWRNGGRHSANCRKARWGGAYGSSSGGGASPSRVGPARRRRCSPSTTGSACSPTTAPPSSPSSRSSPSSPAPTTTCGPLPAGHGRLAVRGRLPAHRRRALPVRPRPPVGGAVDGPAGGRRHATGRVVPRQRDGQRRHRLPPPGVVRAGGPAARRGAGAVLPAAQGFRGRRGRLDRPLGGISRFRLAAGRDLAACEGGAYESYGAEPSGARG